MAVGLNAVFNPNTLKRNGITSSGIDLLEKIFFRIFAIMLDINFVTFVWLHSSNYAQDL